MNYPRPAHANGSSFVVCLVHVFVQPWRPVSHAGVSDQPLSGPRMNLSQTGEILHTSWFGSPNEGHSRNMKNGASVLTSRAWWSDFGARQQSMPWHTV